jgi:hypothetical protein
VAKSIMFDQRQGEYGPFFVDDFAVEALGASRDVESLRRITFDLVADWRSASYAGALPSLIPMSIKSFHDGFVNSKQSASGVLKFSEAILAKLSREITDLTCDPALQRSIQTRLIQISSDIIEIDASLEQVLDQEIVWQQFLALHPFVLGLHATMRQTYLSVYGAYENFVVRLLALARPGERIRVTNKEFKSLFRASFGDMVETVWFEPSIHAARLVRHSLMHAGGRVTKDLRSIQIPVVEHDDHLHVYPGHIRTLYQKLKVPALELISSKVFR